MPPPPTPQYLFLLMTERGGTIIFCRILAPPQCPPQSSDATILISLNDRQGALLSFLGFLRPPMPPSPDTTIINNLNDRGGGGRHYVCSISAPPMPPPHPTTPQYLTILMTERGGSIVFCRILVPPPLPRRHNT